MTVIEEEGLEESSYQLTKSAARQPLRKGKKKKKKGGKSVRLSKQAEITTGEAVHDKTKIAVNLERLEGAELIQSNTTKGRKKKNKKSKSRDKRSSLQELEDS